MSETVIDLDADALSPAQIHELIRAEIIGDRVPVPGPFGDRPLVYADYTASGRALRCVERTIAEVVLPRYGNTHSESSYTGLHTTRLREQARGIVRDGLGAGDDIAVIFTGSGATAAVDKLVALLGLRDGERLDPPPIVLVGPYEHHSNLLPWRESTADVVTVGADATGHIDLAELDVLLRRYADRPLKIGTFSAASNVTGVITDLDAVASVLHEHGALSVCDYAAGAPYLPIEMGRLGLDAVFLSPHKFVGGPGSPGVLAVRRSVVRRRIPVVPGGGTVAYVNEDHQRYFSALEVREEGGTPEIIGAIRAGLAFQLKAAADPETILRREHELLDRALARWRGVAGLELLGPVDAERLPIVSFVVRHRDGLLLHHNFVVQLLNDLFGIQVRGGCACAGPYGHRLLGIDDATSRAYETEIMEGYDGIKPGWVRLNLPYFADDETIDYLIEAVAFVAEHGAALLGDYTFDLSSGLWKHRNARDPGTTDLFAHLLAPTVPAPIDVALPALLDRADEIVGSAGGTAGARPADTARWPREVEQLRWFAV